MQNLSITKTLVSKYAKVKTNPNKVLAIKPDCVEFGVVTINANRKAPKIDIINKANHPIARSVVALN